MACDMEKAVLSHLVNWELEEAWTLLKRDIEFRHIVLFTATSVGVTSLVRVIASSLSSRRERNRLAQLRVLKQKEREQALEKLRRKLSASALSSERAEEVVGLSVIELTERLRSGQLSPVEVLNAYQYKALIVHDQTNCLVEPILEAEEYASSLELSKSEDKLLYGVPVSVKDCFCIKGYDSTIGCSLYINQPFEEESVILQVLKHQGAVPFVKTNIPQTMISLETTNPIFGRTINPYDHSRSTGGSSGGEAALIAGRGSILGVGSDIGGSLRCPAAACGICSLKVTSLRISAKGKHTIMKGQRNVPGCNGPMSNSVDGLILWMKALTGSSLMYELDPSLPVQPFNSEILNEKRKLRIGYYDFNGEVEAIPAVTRAVHETKAILENMGHTVIPWNFLQGVSAELRFQFLRSLFADAGKGIYDLLKNDALDDSMGRTFSVISSSLLFRRAMLHLCKLLNFPAARKIEPMCGYRDGAEAWEHYQTIKTMRDKVIQDWNRNKLDAVICPVYGTVAVPNGSYQNINEVNGYLSVYNVLDFVAGTLPVSTVTRDDEAALESYPSILPDSKLYKVIRKAMIGSQGLPINVQVVTLPFREELCLRVMNEIETGIASRKKNH